MGLKYNLLGFGMDWDYHEQRVLEPSWTHTAKGTIVAYKLSPWPSK